MSISASCARCVAHPAFLTYACPRRGERVSAPPHSCTKVQLSTCVQVYLDSLCQEHQALCQKHQVLEGGNKARAHHLCIFAVFLLHTVPMCVLLCLSETHVEGATGARGSAAACSWPRPSGMANTIRGHESSRHKRMSLVEHLHHAARLGTLFHHRLPHRVDGGHGKKNTCIRYA